MRLPYTLAMYALLPVLFGYFLWRSRREPGYREGWSERLGFAERVPATDVWVHAASVGELQASVPLLRALLASKPGCRIRVTSFTPTGLARAEALKLRGVVCSYLPVDTPGAVCRFLKRVRPAVGVIMETECWPNLLRACARREIPVIYASSRLSTRSRQKLQQHLSPRLLDKALTAVHWAGAQSEADAGEWKALGLPQDRIEVIGNLKFDYPIDPAVSAQGLALRRQWQALERPVWIAASTHEGEEQQLLEVHKKMLDHYPDLLLILAPRHPQRFNRVYDLIHEMRLAPAQRSHHDVVDDDIEVLLVDTLGELPILYAAADVAFVGGSLVPVGGHNLLEAVAVEVPVIVGPHMRAQQGMAGALRDGGGLAEVSDVAQFETVLAEFLSNPEKRRVQAHAAARVMAHNRGALQRTLDRILQHLDNGK